MRGPIYMYSTGLDCSLKVGNNSLILYNYFILCIFLYSQKNFKFIFYSTFFCSNICICSNIFFFNICSNQYYLINYDL